MSRSIVRIQKDLQLDSTNVFRDIDPKTAKRWLLVPGDWRRPGVEEEYEILWDTTRRFGQVWPRPGPSEVSSFYDVENYYTHGGGEKLPHQAQSFSQRLQTKIAWLGDKGIEPGAEW
jgi:hypothetical protein